MEIVAFMTAQTKVKRQEIQPALVGRLYFISPQSAATSLSYAEFERRLEEVHNQKVYLQKALFQITTSPTGDSWQVLAYPRGRYRTKIEMICRVERFGDELTTATWMPIPIIRVYLGYLLVILPIIVGIVMYAGGTFPFATPLLFIGLWVGAIMGIDLFRWRRELRAFHKWVQRYLSGIYIDEDMFV